MSRYQTALQSFSIESLIGSCKDGCNGVYELDTGGGDSGLRPGDSRGCSPADRAVKRTSAFYRRTSDAPVISPPHAWPPSSDHRRDTEVDHQHRRLSTFFNNMLDTALQQQQQPMESSPMLNFDYVKVLQLQSAAAAAAATAAGKPYSSLSLWPYLNDVVVFPQVPPPPASHCDNAPRSVCAGGDLQPSFGCGAGDADSDDTTEDRAILPPNGPNALAAVGKSSNNDGEDDGPGNQVNNGDDDLSPPNPWFGEYQTR